MRAVRPESKHTQEKDRGEYSERISFFVVSQELDSRRIHDIPLALYATKIHRNVFESTISLRRSSDNSARTESVSPVILMLLTAASMELIVANRF